jgi:hypothetical protein
VDPVVALSTPTSAPDPDTSEKFRQLINSSVTNSTWGKYASAFSAFACFEASQCTSYEWPLSKEVCRAFAVWGFTERKWQQTTIKAYLSALKFIHHIRGLPCHHLTEDPILALIVKGVGHAFLATNTVSSTRRVVSFPLLLTISHKIAASAWNPLSKQVIFAAATTAFFASTRMIEILASAELVHAPSSDLVWKDVLFTPSGSILLRIKQPKSGDKEGEFVDLFPFPGYHCCPVKALKNLKKKQEEAGVFSMEKPVFRFGSGSNLTKQHFNKVLAELLKDMCHPGIDSISCHSFRAGIPSTLSLFPELATSDLIKGWGRWQSDCYTRYTRLQLPQREKIFGHISGALQSVFPPPRN